MYSGSGKDYVSIVAGLVVYKVLSGLFAAMAFYVLAPCFAWVVGAFEYVGVFRLFSLSVLLRSAYGALNAYLYGVGRIDLANFCYSLGFVVGYVSSLVFVLDGLGVLGYIMGFIVGDVVQFIVLMFVSRDVLRRCVGVGFVEAVRSLKMLFTLGVSLYASKILDLLYQWPGKVLVLSFLSVRELGLYGVATRFASILEANTGAVSTALTPYYGYFYGVDGV